MFVVNGCFIYYCFVSNWKLSIYILLTKSRHSRKMPRLIIWIVLEQLIALSQWPLQSQDVQWDTWPLRATVVSFVKRISFTQLIRPWGGFYWKHDIHLPNASPRIQVGYTKEFSTPSPKEILMSSLFSWTNEIIRLLLSKRLTNISNQHKTFVLFPYYFVFIKNLIT